MDRDPDTVENIQDLQVSCKPRNLVSDVREMKNGLGDTNTAKHRYYSFIRWIGDYIDMEREIQKKRETLPEESHMDSEFHAEVPTIEISEEDFSRYSGNDLYCLTHKLTAVGDSENEWRNMRYFSQLKTYPKSRTDAGPDRLCFQDAPLLPEHRMLMLMIQDEVEESLLKYWLEANWTILRDTVLNNPDKKKLCESVAAKYAKRDWSCHLLNLYHGATHDEKNACLEYAPWIPMFRDIFDVYIVKMLPIPTGSIFFEPFNARYLLGDSDCEEAFDLSALQEGFEFIRDVFMASWHPEPPCRKIAHKKKTKGTNMDLFVHRINTKKALGFSSHLFHQQDGEMDVTFCPGRRIKITKIMPRKDLPYFDKEKNEYGIVKNVRIVLTDIIN